MNSTRAAFEAIGSNVTIGDMITFVNNYFKPEGQELEEVQIEGFVQSPKILDNVTDPIYKGFVSKVNSYWELLIRQTNESALCQPGVCESSLIPLNHTIVVPGGRYREIYYWDSYWILQGLLASELHQYAWNLLQNMLDMIEVSFIVWKQQFRCPVPDHQNYSCTASSRTEDASTTSTGRSRRCSRRWLMHTSARRAT